MMHMFSCDAMKDEFLALCKKDFEITGGSKSEQDRNIPGDGTPRHDCSEAGGKIYQDLSR